MEIEIKNFGPIDNVKFNLEKDIHLIYGKNSIGKSYVAYCIYCFIKNIKNLKLSSIERELFILFKDQKIPDIAKFKDKILNKALDYVEIINVLLKNLFLNDFHNSLKNSFTSLDNLKNRFSNKNFEINIIISETENLKIYSDENEKFELEYNNNNLNNEFNEYFKDLIDEKKSKESGILSIRSIDDFLLVLSSKLMVLLHKFNFNIRDVFFIPAGRSGLYQALNSFTPILAELSQNRYFLKGNSFTLPSLSEPISDYILDLSTLNNSINNPKFENIINLFQKNILDGEIEYDQKTKRIFFIPTNTNLKLNLSETSSMVAELSPLVLYFKHIINNKFSNIEKYPRIYFRSLNRRSNNYFDLIFIEEPEAHMHPDAQIELVKILSKLPGLNLKIIITSHSDYMLNKFSNLIIKEEIKHENIQVYYLIKKDNGTIIDESMNVTKEGISDENFHNANEDLYNERSDFYEKENAGKN